MALECDLQIVLINYIGCVRIQPYQAATAYKDFVYMRVPAASPDDA